MFSLCLSDVGVWDMERTVKLADGRIIYEEAAQKMLEARGYKIHHPSTEQEMGETED